MGVVFLKIWEEFESQANFSGSEDRFHAIYGI